MLCSCGDARWGKAGRRSVGETVLQCRQLTVRGLLYLEARSGHTCVPCLPAGLFRNTLFPTTTAAHRDALINVALLIVDLIRQDCLVDERLALRRNKHAEHHVHKTRGHEAQEPAKVIRPLSHPNLDARIDAVYQSGEVRRNANKKCDNRSPVAAVRVPVDAVRLVQRKRVVLARVDQPKVKDHDRRNGSEEDGVRDHEVEEAPCAREDLPGDQGPRHDRADELASPDVDEARKQRRQIVRRGQRVGGDVDAQRGQSEAEGPEEAARAVVPVRDQRDRVPVELAVLDGAGRRGRDADERDEGEDERQERDVDDLPLDADAGVAGEISLGFPNDTRQTRQKRPRIRRPLQRRLLIPHLAAIRRSKRPDQDSNPSHRHNNRLCHKQPAQIIRMHTQKRQREEPEQKKADHGISLDALTLRNAIAQRQKRGPDSAQHALDRIRAVHVLNRKPEDGQDGARHYRYVRAPETPRGARQHGERRVVDDADGAVERDHEGDDEEGEGHDAEGFAPCEAWTGW
ncbi:hypothetical protein OPT61_g10154 [Boeremia exigua]|uniref:Uncharacterized protein n=1 Tax=Boeremia exigua TaxID=749465 RepID=A0ACC2HQY9_9PLEO|nr:hypothetical protein OPT61_g10154 [Boeremia exigua]